MTRTSVPPRAPSKTSPAPGWSAGHLSAAPPRAGASFSRTALMPVRNAVQRPELQLHQMALNRGNGPGNGVLAQGVPYQTPMAAPRSGAPVVSRQKAPGAAYPPSLRYTGSAPVSVGPAKPVMETAARSQTRNGNAFGSQIRNGNAFASQTPNGNAFGSQTRNVNAFGSPTRIGNALESQARNGNAFGSQTRKMNSFGSQTWNTNTALGKLPQNSGQTSAPAAAPNAVVPPKYSAGPQLGTAHSGARGSLSGVAALNRAVTQDLAGSQNAKTAARTAAKTAAETAAKAAALLRHLDSGTPQNAATAAHGSTAAASPWSTVSSTQTRASNLGGERAMNSPPKSVGASKGASQAYKAVSSLGGANSGPTGTSPNAPPSGQHVAGAVTGMGGAPRGVSGGNHHGDPTSVNTVGAAKAKVEPPPVPLLENKPQSGQSLKSAPDADSKTRQLETAKPAGALGPALAVASGVQSPSAVTVAKVMSDRGNARGIQTPPARDATAARGNAPPRADHAPLTSYALPSNRFRGNQATVRGIVPANRVRPADIQQRAVIYQRGANTPNLNFQGNARFRGNSNFPHVTIGAQAQLPRTVFPGRGLPSAYHRAVSTGPQRAVGQRSTLTGPQTWTSSQKRTNGMGYNGVPSYRSAVPRQHSNPIFLYKHSPGSQLKRNLKRTIEASAAKARKRLLELRRK